VETIRRKAVARRAPVWVRRLLAAVVAAGTATSAVGQTADPAVSVEAPRAQVAAPPSPLSVLPDAAQAAAFRTSPVTMPTQDQPQPAPPSSSTLGMPSPVGSLPATTSGAPFNSGNWQPVMMNGPLYPPMPAPPVAPAWRWHGYGAVTPAEPFQQSTPALESAIKDRQPAGASPLENPGTDTPRLPATPSPAPPGDTPRAPSLSDVNSGPQWKPPAAVPAYVPPADPNPPSPSAAPPGQPLSSAEPAWRSGVQRVVYNQANPMTAGPAPWIAAAPPPVVVMTAAATTVEYHGPAVTLDAPRPAGTYISRAVSDAPVQPASYIAPPVPAKTQPVGVLPTVRTSIEHVCAGRVRDVEIVNRGASSLLVRLKVRQTADAEFVANAIARLPELGPYQVLFEMQVVR
jgi:hypothetical protein